MKKLIRPLYNKTFMLIMVACNFFCACSMAYLNEYMATIAWLVAMSWAMVAYNSLRAAEEILKKYEKAQKRGFKNL